ncbi:hypothetical protein D3C86_1997280 [compost metagenome]
MANLELQLVLAISNLEAVMTEPLLVLVFHGIFLKTLILVEILKTCIQRVLIMKPMKASITIKNWFRRFLEAMKLFLMLLFSDN